MIYNSYQDTANGIAGISVVSSGHIFAHCGRKIDRPDGRSDFLLFYVAKGNELFSLENDIVANEGSFIFFRPFEQQKHIFIDKKIGEFYYIHFNAPSDFDLFGFESSTVYHSHHSTAVCDIFEEIISELQEKQPVYERICVSKFFMLVSMLERNLKKETTNNGKNYNKMLFIIQNMNIHYGNDYSLDDYARMCNISKYHFSRLFREITGLSPIEYRNNIRLDHAREQIKNTNTPINEIAEKTGFASSSYFCTAFKRKFGISPFKFRANERI